MYELKMINELTQIFAKKIKQERLRQNKTQEEFSSKAGVKLSTYKTFENKGKGSFETFLLILKAFGKMYELETILNEPDFSPKEEIMNKHKQLKKRASNKSKKKVIKSFIKPSNNSIISNIINNKKNNYEK